MIFKVEKYEYEKLIDKITYLQIELSKKDEVIKLLADRVFKECKHKCKSVDDIIDLAFDVVENVEEEND